MGLLGSGSNQSTSTTKSELSPQVAAASNKYLTLLQQLTAPGGQLPAMGTGPQPFQEVAPMTPQQLQSQQLVSSESFGPGGAPAGGQAPSPHDLVTTMMGTPYWWSQLGQNPWLLQAFSNPALNQVGQIYG